MPIFLGGLTMVMINEILSALKIRLEATLQSIQSRDEDWIRLTNLYERDGTAVPNTDNFVIMSVASIQSDASLGTYKAAQPSRDDSYIVRGAPLFLDVYIMFTSTLSGDNYAPGLAALSRIVSHFQEQPIIESVGSSAIGDQMGRLAVEFASPDFAQAASLATVTGVKGLPFILYRLRRLPFDGAAITDIAPPVLDTGENKVRSKG